MDSKAIIDIFLKFLSTKKVNEKFSKVIFAMPHSSVWKLCKDIQHLTFIETCWRVARKKNLNQILIKFRKFWWIWSMRKNYWFTKILFKNLRNVKIIVLWLKLSIVFLWFTFRANQESLVNIFSKLCQINSELKDQNEVFNYICLNSIFTTLFRIRQ